MIVSPSSGSTLNDQSQRAITVGLEGVEQGDTACYAPLAVIYETLGELDTAKRFYRLAVEDGEDWYQDDLDALERS